MRPWLVKPWSTVSCANVLKKSSATTRRTESVEVVKLPLMELLPPRANSVPWLTSGALMVLLRSSSEALLVSVLAPFRVVLESSSEPAVTLKASSIWDVALPSAKVPPVTWMAAALVSERILTSPVSCVIVRPLNAAPMTALSELPGRVSVSQFWLSSQRSVPAPPP
jgi:hypothetical protein